jgi:hypothetical protein
MQNGWHARLKWDELLAAPHNHKESNVTTQDKIARRKLSLLELASDLKNVSKVCKITGYSRQQFYEIR